MTDRRRLPALWQVALASVWLVLFIGFSLTLELPNNRPIRRSDLLQLIPELLELVDPSEPGPGEPPDAVALRAKSGWRFFPQRFDLLAIAGVIAAGAWALGSLALRACRVSPIGQSLEHTVFAFGLGYTVLSLATLLTGLAGFLSRPFCAGLIGLGLLVELALRWRDRGTILRRDARPDHSRWLWIAVIGAAPFLLAMLLGSLLPSVDFDVNEYHFEGPKEYYQSGRIGFLPHNVYTSFPFGTEMLTLLAMVLRGDWYRGALAGKCVLMTFGPLTGLALYAAGRRWFSEKAGILAAFLYLTTPWTYRISTIAYVEGGLSFFLFASLLALWLGIERESLSDPPSARSPEDMRETRTRRHSYLLIAGLLAGSAMACKYPGVVSVVIPLFLFVAWHSFRPRERVFRVADGSLSSSAASATGLTWVRLPLTFGIGVLITIGPWLTKNLLETGNPVYPLLYTVFGGKDWNADLNAKWRNGHSPHSHVILGDDRESLVNMAIDVVTRNDWVNPLLFACAALTLLSRDLRRQTRWLWIYVGYLFLSWWALTHRIDRFWLPMTPVVALLAGVGGVWFVGGDQPAVRLSRKKPGSWWRCGLLGTGIVVTTLVNLVLITSRLGGFNNYLLDLDVAGKLAARVTAPDVLHINDELPPGSKVLAVGDAEMFEARFPAVYNTVFDKSIFEEWFGDPSTDLPAKEKPFRSAEAIREKLRAEGITHLYVNWLEILRYRSPGNYGYTDFVTPRRFIDLQKLNILGEPWPNPQGLMEVSRLNADWQPELRAFGPELIKTLGNTEVFTTYQVFPVNADDPR